MDEKLKPCPFCGGKAKLNVQRHNGKQYDYAQINCQKCGAKIRHDIDVEYSATGKCVEAWNRRADNDM